MNLLKLSEKTIKYLKLFLTGIILVWLYIRSPFNPLYSDSTPGEWAFVKLNFIYWLVVSVFLIWIIYFIKKKNFDKYSLFVFTAANFLYISFYIFYGFDVTDTGFSLSKQWAMYNGLWEENFDAIAGTNLIGGLWLKLYGEPMLIWARLGFVFVQTLIVLVSYKIMLIYFKPKQIFTVMLPMSLFLAIWYLYFTINYDNLSYLFYLLSVYCLLRGLSNEIYNRGNLVISGLFYSIAVFCKISYFPAFILPIIVIYYEDKIFQKGSIRIKLLHYVYGVFIGVCTIIMFLYFVGGLNHYLEYFNKIVNELFRSNDPLQIQSHNHSLSKLYVSYKKEILQVLFQISKILFISLMIEYLASKFTKLPHLKYWVITIVSFSLYNTIFTTGVSDSYFFEIKFNIVSFILTIYLIWFVFSKNYNIKNYSVIILASILLMMFSFAGSDLGIRASYHVGSGLIFFSLPLILNYENSLKIQGYNLRFSSLFYFVIIVFFINSINKKDNLYREVNFRFLNSNFESNSLTGIKSSSSRVEAVDSLLLFLAQKKEYSKYSTLFTHNNALMYYLTEKKYSLVTPWDVLSDYHSIEEDLKELQLDILVVPKISHRISEWPNKGPKDLAEIKLNLYYEAYDKFIRDNNYKIIYKNFFYTVYAREDLEVEEHNE